MNRSVSIPGAAGRAFRLRWCPSPDVLVAIVSWLLISATLYMATDVVGDQIGGGLPYYGLMTFLAATLFGIGMPLYWLVVGRRRPLADLGLHAGRLGLSLVLQLGLTIGMFWFVLAGRPLPDLAGLIPLVILSLALGFFEAVFWRGWMLLRLEESFGLVPALLLSALMYTSYQIGFGIRPLDIVLVFVLGLVYGIAFRLTRSVFALWPALQPVGIFAILLGTGMQLPLISSLGFVEVLAVMLLLVWLAGRYARKAGARSHVRSES
jgi:membrane protease YdiL (CAAX protease family)